MDKIYKYITEHSTSRPQVLDWLERQTHLRTNHARMLSGAVQGQLLTMLTRLISPSHVLELGTFTGYSAICMALALEEGATLDTLEVNDELEDLILEGFERTGVSDKIKLHIGDAKQTLRDFAKEMKQSGQVGSVTVLETSSRALYDMVYIDANKREYCEYYDLVFDMVRPGGYILADNVLWDGKVVQDPIPQDAQTQEILRFNAKVASDPRVECVILPLRDGLSLIRKKDEQGEAPSF